MASTPFISDRARRRLPEAAVAVALLVDALFFVSGLSQTALVPLLPRMAAVFGLSPSASAFVLSLPALATLVVSMPAAMLADRFGARRVTIASGVLLVAGSLLGCGGSLGALIAGRAIYGVSFGMLWTAGAAWLAELGGPRRVGPAIICSSVGTMLGPTLGGLLATGATGTVPFALIAAAGAVVSVALVRAPGRSDPVAPRRADAGTGRVPMRSLLHDRWVIAGVGSLVVSGALSGATQLLIARGLHGDGVSTGATGLAFSACAVGYIVVSSTFVAVGARGHTPLVNVVVTGLGAIALAPALVSSAPAVLIAALMFTAAPRGAISVVAYSVAGSGGESGAQGGGAVFGLLGGAWAAANVLTPLSAGTLVQQAGPHVAYLAAIVPSVLITIVLVAALPRRTRALCPSQARTRSLVGLRRGRVRRGGAVGGRRPVAIHALQPAQLLERDVAADAVPRLLLDQLRLGRLTDLPDLARTARLERAARRRVGRARDLALQPDAEAVEVVDARHR
jgi:YNFM family putative membrane transporter